MLRQSLTRLLAVALMITASQAQAEESASVSTQSFSDIALFPSLEVPATVESLNDARLSAEVSAVVAAIPVKIGDVVAKGAVLLQFDAEDYRLRLKQAQAALRGLEAQLELADYQLQRVRLLAAQDAASEEQVRQREAEHKSLQAELAARRTELAIAKRNLKKCVVRAPFRAIVRERIVQLRELANPGTPLLRIVDAENIEVVAKLQASDALAAAQQSAAFRFETRTASYPVNLRVIAPVFDSRERSREARFRFDSDKALAGSAGKIVWRKQRPHLPAELLMRRNNQLGVFVAENDRARFIPLPDAREGRPAEVELPPDTRIVVDGRFALQADKPLSVK